MGNQISKFNSLRLPDEIGEVTLNNLMNHPDTDVIKRGNRLSLRRRLEHGTATLELMSHDTGRREMRLSSIPTRLHKKDYADDILEMKRQGYKQKDIAFQLGMSEGYVSQILNDLNE